MKKLLSLAVIVIGLNAYQIDIKSGWQLKGALEDINVTDVFNESEIISVWTYDGDNNKWRAYLPNMNIDLSNYDDIEPLNVIHKGEGFWVSANNNLLIETNSKTNISDSNVSYTGTITENNLIDTPTTFSLSDIANKTFKVFVEDDFIEITFNSNGIANITVGDGTYKAKFENGVIKVYDEGNNLVNEFKKVKADSNGIIVFGKDLDDNEYFLEPWLTNINPIDMSTLNYPFTVYEADYDHVSKITFENNKILFESGRELNTTIEDGKIISIVKENINGNGGYRDAYQIQYIGEIDKYKIFRMYNSVEYWITYNNLVGFTFNDIIGTDQSIIGYILHSDGTAYDSYSKDYITYQLISPTEINLIQCDDDNSCYTEKVIVDSSTGKIKSSFITFSCVTIHSEDPIIIGNNDSNSTAGNNEINEIGDIAAEMLFKNNSIKNKILQKYKKFNRKLF